MWRLPDARFWNGYWPMRQSNSRLDCGNERPTVLIEVRLILWLILRSKLNEWPFLDIEGTNI